MVETYDGRFAPELFGAAEGGGLDPHASARTAFEAGLDPVQFTFQEICEAESGGVEPHPFGPIRLATCGGSAATSLSLRCPRRESNPQARPEPSVLSEAVYRFSTRARKTSPWRRAQESNQLKRLIKPLLYPLS